MCGSKARRSLSDIEGRAMSVYPQEPVRARADAPSGVVEFSESWPQESPGSQHATTAGDGAKEGGCARSVAVAVNETAPTAAAAVAV
jgi:hypothetical protein